MAPTRVRIGAVTGQSGGDLIKNDTFSVPKVPKFDGFLRHWRCESNGVNALIDIQQPSYRIFLSQYHNVKKCHKFKNISYF